MHYCENLQPFEPRAKIHNRSTSQKQGKSYSFIAETIGVATSTVSREIRRNQTPSRKIFMSAGGDICLGTQGMALLSAQIQLEDAA
ncbi:helix-turn-helix domain-containing protein [Porphyromonas endodontalis]|uniref:helix-turn-helix domain-containing protein n=1 Tax=Porphyromonas endodontalis TaxID=28124 RepID=UPI001558817D|nr:helix-turn-helix domain-containing protein [Porphyromonas endodontalis]